MGYTTHLRFICAHPPSKDKETKVTNLMQKLSVSTLSCALLGVLGSSVPALAADFSLSGTLSGGTYSSFNGTYSLGDPTMSSPISPFKVTLTGPTVSPLIFSSPNDVGNYTPAPSNSGTGFGLTFGNASQNLLLYFSDGTPMAATNGSSSFTGGPQTFDASSTTGTSAVSVPEPSLEPNLVNGSLLCLGFGWRMKSYRRTKLSGSKTA